MLGALLAALLDRCAALCVAAAQSEPSWKCNQTVTTNATIGHHGTSITVR